MINYINDLISKGMLLPLNKVAVIGPAWAMAVHFAVRSKSYNEYNEYCLENGQMAIVYIHYDFVMKCVAYAREHQDGI